MAAVSGEAREGLRELPTQIPQQMRASGLFGQVMSEGQVSQVALPPNTYLVDVQIPSATVYMTGRRSATAEVTAETRVYDVGGVTPGPQRQATFDDPFASRFDLTGRASVLVATHDVTVDFRTGRASLSNMSELVHELGAEVARRLLHVLAPDIQRAILEAPTAPPPTPEPAPTPPESPEADPEAVPPGPSASAPGPDTAHG